MALTHLTFGKEFTEAMEAKQVSVQEAKRTRFVVERLSSRRRQPSSVLRMTPGQASLTDLLPAHWPPQVMA